MALNSMAFSLICLWVAGWTIAALRAIRRPEPIPADCHRRRRPCPASFMA